MPPQRRASSSYGEIWPDVELSAARSKAYVPKPQEPAGIWKGYSGGRESPGDDLDTGVDRERLAAFLESLTRMPENFHTHPKIQRLLHARRDMARGERPLDAAFRGSKEIAFTIVSMTISLSAVFLPILFMRGLVGRLFHEFAVTIGAAILVSGFVLKGLVFSVQLTLIAMVGGIVLGTALALMRLSGKPWLVMPAAAYVNTMRSIPLVMVILWFFLLIPLLTGRPLGAEVSAMITFTLFEAAYYSEIMRSGCPRA